MRTSIVALALVLAVPMTAFADGPQWQPEYSAAQQKAIDQQKPLAVIFGAGANGWQQLGGGAIPDEASQALGAKYVCCYVDTATPAGQSLAKRFDISGSVGIVISDRTGNLQAFWHEGPLPADTLARHLTRYADPQRVASTTDTNSSATRTSFYPTSGVSTTAQPFCRT